MADTVYGASQGITKFAPSAKTPSFFQGEFNSVAADHDPLLSGYAFIRWITLPSWVEKGVPEFAQLTQKNLRNFGGITDIDLTTTTIQEGFSASENHFAASSQRWQGFTMSHREWSGSPIRNAYSHWTMGIRDPATNTARYPKDYGIEYSARNHTGSLLYVMTRPDADNVDANNIEFACLYTMVMPLKAPFGHLNFAAGTNDGTEIEIPFAGVPHVNDKVNALAALEMKKAVAASTGYQFQTMSGFIPPKK